MIFYSGAIIFFSCGIFLFNWLSDVFDGYSSLAEYSWIMNILTWSCGILYVLSCWGFFVNLMLSI